MARPRNGVPPHVKRVRSKGKTYYYFDTGRVKPNGAPIYKRLPDIGDKAAFGGAYAAQLAHRTRAGNVASVVLVSELIDRYQRSREFSVLAKSSQITYNIYLGQLLGLIGMAPVHQVEPKDVIGIIDKMADRPGAANMMLSVIGALFAWGRKPGRDHVPLEVDPIRGIEGFEPKDYEPWPEHLLAAALTPQIEKAAESATEARERLKNEQVRRIVSLLFFTAQRVGDVAKMRWSDIDGGVLHVIQEKTRKELWIPIHPQLSLALGARPNQDAPLIANRDGKPYAKKSLRMLLQAWATKHGEKVVAHGLRKNAVNALLECGCSVGETSSISGQSLQMVEHYAKRRSGRRMAASAMAKLTAPTAEAAHALTKEHSHDDA